MMFLSWILTVFVSLLQLVSILLLAPWMRILTQGFERKIQGKGTSSFIRVWSETVSQVYRPLWNFSGFTSSQKTFLYVLFLGMSLMITLLIPDFTTGTLLGESSDFLAIISLLMLMPAFFFFLIYDNSTLLCFRKVQNRMFEILLFLPMLFLILLICRFSTASTVLDRMVLFFHQGDSLMVIALSPLFISACSLFFIVMDMPDFSKMIEKDGFTAKERSLLLYGHDLQYLGWLSLISFLLWPQSLAVLDLSKVAFAGWLLALFFGVLAWLVKLGLACFLVALMRNILFLSSHIHKAGIATLLNFIALMLYFAGLNGH